MRNTSVLEQILGKRISGFEIRESITTCSSLHQLFLVFNDGTHVELYGELSIAGGVDRGNLANLPAIWPEQVLVHRAGQ
jgi:hypothetical protein